MLNMFSASEARATAYLLSAEDYSFYQHLEIRILDSVQHGGTYIIYTGEIPLNVLDALDALGYIYVRLEHDDEVAYRITWAHPKGVSKDG